jgi:hypothetical protein
MDYIFNTPFSQKEELILIELDNEAANSIRTRYLPFQ